MSRSLGWYARRLRGMSAREVVQRSQDSGRQLLWARRQVRVEDHQPALAEIGARPDRTFGGQLPGWARDKVGAEARDAVVRAADRLLAGEWDVLGTAVPSIRDPDWFLDPVTGRHAPADRLCFRIDQRDESVTGNVKAVWELSRHHHLTVLAAAYWLTEEDEYAEVAAHQLRSWWAANPFLSGVHWTSGIEIGIRLISWAWVRRLLDGWDGAAALFEDEPLAVRQIWWHQRHLDAFRSSGSSANNHVVAEAAGRVVAAHAFPWYAESERWRVDATAQLQDVLAANTFASGINRELATDYHGFVAELGLVAAAEAARAGHPVDDRTWTLLRDTLDAAAAITDVAGRPPRQGDGDEGRALVVDDPATEPWTLLLGVGAEVFGEASWWPRTSGSVAAVVLAALTDGRVASTARPVTRPFDFPDAGLTILRSDTDDDTPGGPELWCRCDGGPHGFLSIAAHGHADALAVEVRHGGVEVLVDPGTYCYHGEPAWRSYFRSTLAHNTLEVDSTSQSREGGPFLWSQQATTSVEEARPHVWRARVTGHPVGDAGLVHRRTVRLDGARTLHLDDEVRGDAAHDVRLALHLGPEVAVRLERDRADLAWTRDGVPVAATLHLPAALTWTAHRGETDPVLGWFSPRFGTKVPTTTLVGSGRTTAGAPLALATRLVVEDAP